MTVESILKIALKTLSPCTHTCTVYKHPLNLWRKIAL